MPVAELAESVTRGGAMHARHYWNLVIMTALSFIAMYVLMYSMVDRFARHRLPEVARKDGA